MSRVSIPKQRLRLFEKGNDRCPICFAPFSRKEVLAGKLVTLEHVPPKSLKKVLSVSSIGACLTCSDCNHTAGRQADQLAAQALKEPKVHVQIGGVSHVGALSLGSDDVFNVSFNQRMRPIEYRNLKAKDYKVTFKMPNSRYTDASWLKSAYLAVFCLLGRHGYKFADGDAIRKVRAQIMRPAKEILGRIGFGRISSDSGYDDSCIVMCRNAPRSCWMVKFGEYVVLLPCSWDTSFYDHLDHFQAEGNFTISNTYTWEPIRFGETSILSYTCGEGVDMEKILGEDPFGNNARMEGDDGSYQHYALADYHGRELILLPVWEPYLDELRR